MTLILAAIIVTLLTLGTSAAEKFSAPATLRSGQVEVSSGNLGVSERYGPNAQTVYVDACNPNVGDGSESDPYHSLTTGIGAVDPGGSLIIEHGPYGDTPVITMAMTIDASGGATVIGQYFTGAQEVCLPVIPHEYGGWFSTGELPHDCDAGTSDVQIGARIYYPATVPDGVNVACQKPFPLIVYAHGLRFGGDPLCTWSNPGPIYEDFRQMENIFPSLAEEGFIVVSIDASWGIDDRARASLLLNAVAYMRSEHLRSGSWLEGAVDLTNVALAGHSMGGGGAFNALMNLGDFDEIDLTDVQLQAVAGLSPGMLSDADGVGVPSVIFYGTNDLAEPTGDGARGMYAHSDAPKHFVFINGANHFGYTDGICLANSDEACEVGGRADQEAQALQQQTALDYLRAFFRAYLLNDSDQLDYITQAAGQQCGDPGDPPNCPEPQQSFADLDALNVDVDVCSCTS